MKQEKKPYEFGQFVRSQGGHPARALNGSLCIYRTDTGELSTDLIRHIDMTIREQDCPTLREIENYQKDTQRYIFEDHA